MDSVAGKVELTSPRSAQWPSVRAAWLKLHPICAACGGTTKLQVHHKLPFHLHPALELDPANFITLCESRGFMNCHLLVGHLGNFKSFNSAVSEMASALFAALLHRPEPTYKP